MNAAGQPQQVPPYRLGAQFYKVSFPSFSQIEFEHVSNEEDSTESKSKKNKKQLLDMPNEMLSLIFNEIDSPGDHVCFQLSCHKIAAVTSMFNVRQI